MVGIRCQNAKERELITPFQVLGSSTECSIALKKPLQSLTQQEDRFACDLVFYLQGVLHIFQNISFPDPLIVQQKQYNPFYHSGSLLLHYYLNFPFVEVRPHTLLVFLCNFNLRSATKKLCSDNFSKYILSWSLAGSAQSGWQKRRAKQGFGSGKRDLRTLKRKCRRSPLEQQLLSLFL